MKKKSLFQYPIICVILLTILLGMLGSIMMIFFRWRESVHANEFLMIWGMLSAFFVLPALLSLGNIAGLFWIPKNPVWQRAGKSLEYVTILLGLLYSGIVMVFSDIMTDALWSDVLYNNQVHQPIWTEGLPGVIVLCVLGIIGYFVLSWVPMAKMPPLVAVFSIAAMYAGVAECILWCIQMDGFWILMILPVNAILISFKTIRVKVREWNALEHQEPTRCVRLYHILRNAKLWPVWAVILLLPLLGICLAVFVLCGQSPDYLIKAWTETADWRLSMQTAPPNLYMDEHYLCTVAAGGHKKVVRPIRMGERHGHRVVVNRQLCIANAFEQILEEKTPHFHKHVRHFYDTYGFPIARLIRKKWAADLVYFVMKPLEWVFLIVIYLCDVKPENRIAVQYLPKPEQE